MIETIADTIRVKTGVNRVLEKSKAILYHNFNLNNLLQNSCSIKRKPQKVFKQYTAK